MEDVVVDAVATADVATADFIATDDAANAKIAAGGANIAVGNDYMTDIGYIGGDVMNPTQDTKSANTSTIILWVTIGVCIAIGIALGIILGRKSAMK